MQHIRAMSRRALLILDGIRKGQKMKPLLSNMVVKFNFEGPNEASKWQPGIRMLCILLICPFVVHRCVRNSLHLGISLLFRTYDFVPCLE